MPSKQTSWDYIIVGGGTAGCVLADRLSENSDTSVLLLEAGGRGNSLYIHFPAGFYKLHPKYNWNYEPEPDDSVEGKVEPWPGGRVLGGSSAINATTWTRGHSADFDMWASDGCVGWGYKDVLPYYRRSETFSGGPDEYRGGNGPQHVSFTALRHPLTEVFIQSVEQTGVPYSKDLNAAVQEGVSHQQVSQRRGLRSSAATAYLARARRRNNLTVITGARASRIIVEESRAIGVEYSSSSGRHAVYADREIAISCGAIGTPKLLMLSGIGPPDVLRQLGINVVVDSPNVGSNLQEHAVAGFSYRVSVPTLNMELNPRGYLKHALEFILRGGGGVTASGSAAVAYLQLSADDPRPDIEINFRPLGVAKGGSSHRQSGSARPGYSDMKPMSIPAVQSGVWLLHPRARGAVTLRSADPFDPPVIRHRLLGEDLDLRTLTLGCRLLRNVYAQDAFRPYLVEEITPGANIETDDDFESFLRRSTRHGHHPVGTCAMGDGPDSVVDPQLRVRGVDGLRVIDASIMPRLITGHTNAATVMIAERGSDFLRG